MRITRGVVIGGLLAFTVGCQMNQPKPSDLSNQMADVLRSLAETNGLGKGCAIVYRVKDGCRLGVAELGGMTVDSAYEPGSVVKPLVAVIAANRGIAAADTLVDTDRKDERYYRLPGDGSHVWPAKMSVADALTRSSNIVFGKLGYDLGPVALTAGYQKFGIGSNGGFLPREPAQVDKATWSRMAIGQFVRSTPDEIARAYVVLANRGMSPWTDEQIFPEATVAQFIPALERVVSKEGTARRAAVEGMRVAGKTGTAQRCVDGRYAQGLYTSTFVGFFPVDKPEYVVEVVYQNGDKGDAQHKGGQRPALAFSKIALLITSR